MLNTTTTNANIAVRLYDNQKYGTTYGKGLYRKALYNGTIDIKNSGVKYLVDFHSYSDWANQARTDEQMMIVRETSPDEATLYSWLKRYDNETKTKTSVCGVCLINLETMGMKVGIFDTERGVEDFWELAARPCRQVDGGKRSPQLLATDGDLQDW